MIAKSLSLLVLLCILVSCSSNKEPTPAPIKLQKDTTNQTILGAWWDDTLNDPTAVFGINDDGTMYYPEHDVWFHYWVAGDKLIRTDKDKEIDTIYYKLHGNNKLVIKNECGTDTLVKIERYSFIKDSNYRHNDPLIVSLVQTSNYTKIYKQGSKVNSNDVKYLKRFQVEPAMIDHQNRIAIHAFDPKQELNTVWLYLDAKAQKLFLALEDDTGSTKEIAVQCNKKLLKEVIARYKDQLTPW